MVQTTNQKNSPETNDHERDRESDNNIANPKLILYSLEITGDDGTCECHLYDRDGTYSRNVY